MNRKVSLWVFLLSIWVWVCLIVLFGWSVWHIDNGGKRLGSLDKIVISVAKFPVLVKETFNILTKNQLLLDDKYPYIKSIRLNHNFPDDGYILLSSYDKKYKQSAVNLLRLSDAKILNTWILNFNNLEKWHVFFTGVKKKNFRMIHPLLLEDGSIIFQYESPLIALDLHSNLKWVLRGEYHHSIELDADGNIWVPTIIDSSKVKVPVLKLFDDVALGKISNTGKLIFQKSVAEILLENGFRDLLLGVGSITKDQIHLNDIQPALTTTKYWNKGDLLISLRHRSTVFLYRPITNKIIWLKTGPWLNQHDVDFIDSTRIGIFGNNLIRSSITNHSDFLIDGHNDEYIYDFATNKISTPYTEFFAKSKISTFSEGRSDILENGDIFVEETNFGRLLRGNTKHEIWSLVDRVDNRSISMLGWCRYISKKEFEKKYSKINFTTK